MAQSDSVHTCVAVEKNVKVVRAGEIPLGRNPKPIRNPVRHTRKERAVQAARERSQPEGVAAVEAEEAGMKAAANRAGTAGAEAEGVRPAAPSWAKFKRTNAGSPFYCPRIAPKKMPLCHRKRLPF